MAVHDLTYGRGLGFNAQQVARRQYDYALRQWAEQERRREEDKGDVTVIDARYEVLPAPSDPGESSDE